MLIKYLACTILYPSLMLATYCGHLLEQFAVLLCVQRIVLSWVCVQVVDEGCVQDVLGIVSSAHHVCICVVTVTPAKKSSCNCHVDRQLNKIFYNILAHF